MKTLINNWHNEKYCLIKVKEDGYNLQFVKNKTEAICLAAVRQNIDALEFIDLYKYSINFAEKLIGIYN